MTPCTAQPAYTVTGGFIRANSLTRSGRTPESWCPLQPAAFYDAADGSSWPLTVVGSPLFTAPTVVPPARACTPPYHLPSSRCIGPLSGRQPSISANYILKTSTTASSWSSGSPTRSTSTSTVAAPPSPPAVLSQVFTVALADASCAPHHCN